MYKLDHFIFKDSWHTNCFLHELTMTTVLRPTIVSYSYLFWVKFLVSIELMTPDMYSPLRIGSHTCSSSPSVPPHHSWWPYLCNIHHPNSLHLIHFQEVFEFAQASYWRGEGSCLHTGHSSKYEEIIMECSKAPMKKKIMIFKNWYWP